MPRLCNQRSLDAPASRSVGLLINQVCQSVSVRLVLPLLVQTVESRNFESLVVILEVQGWHRGVFFAPPDP